MLTGCSVWKNNTSHQTIPLLRPSMPNHPDGTFTAVEWPFQGKRVAMGICGRPQWALTHPHHGWGLLQLCSLNFSFRVISVFAKSSESATFLTSITTDKVWGHLQNINMISMKSRVFGWFWKTEEHLSLLRSCLWNWFFLYCSTILGPDIHMHGLFCAILFKSMLFMSKALVGVKMLLVDRYVLCKK